MTPHRDDFSQVKGAEKALNQERATSERFRELYEKTRGDVTFWRVIASILAVGLVGVGTWVTAPSATGRLEQPCKPDGTCAVPTLKCVNIAAYSHYNGVWRCRLP